MADKILVAYYSKTGHTKAAAQKIAKAAGGALHEIVPTKEYPASYVATVAVAKWEQLKNEKPALNDKVQGFKDYNVVLVGFPIWWFTCPQLIKTFMESYDFSGKTIVPFCTSSSSGLGSSARNLHSLASDSAVWLDGDRLASGSSRADMVEWINGLGLDIQAE